MNRQFAFALLLTLLVLACGAGAQSSANPCANPDFAAQPVAPAYYFPALPPTAERPGLPVAITVWRNDCSPLTFPPVDQSIWVRMTAQHGENSPDKPKVTIIQDGREIGWFGSEITPMPDGGVSVNLGTVRWHRTFFLTSGVFGSISDVVTIIEPGPSWQPKQAFTLRVRHSGYFGNAPPGSLLGPWPADVPDLEYHIPAAGQPGNVAVLPGQIAGLWWNPAESGWGLSIDRNERGTVFATWFTYDEDGNTTWFVMPHGSATGNNSVAGDVYQPTGPAFSSAAFNSAAVTTGTPVGRFELSFPDNDNGTFSFDVKGRKGSSSLQRLSLRNPAGQVCSMLRGVVWNAVESGWALSLEGGVFEGCPLHATWFTYGLNGKPIWMFAGMDGDYHQSAQRNMRGAAYRPTGSPFGTPYSAARNKVGQSVGEFTLRRGTNYYIFSHDFTYSIGGTQRTVATQRFVFEH